MRYSLGQLLKQALGGHKGWQKTWRSPEPQKKYDVVIIGGGGHGLATAYYLAKQHGIKNVAVLEKGWIGGGNTGRNTTNVRSDYMFPESAALYDFSLKLYEKLALELNFNLMVSQRGWMTLIHDQHQMESARHKANWLKCNGVDGKIIYQDEVQRMLPLMNMDANPRFPVLGAFYQPRGGTIRHDAVAWGYARAADQLGVDIIQNCEVVGFERDGEKIGEINTTRGRIQTDTIGVAVAGHTSEITRMAGFKMPVTSFCLQAMVSEPVKQIVSHALISPGTNIYINQTQKGEVVLGGILDSYNSHAQRGNFPTVEKVVTAAVEMFPSFGQMRLMRHWAGIVDLVPDSSPILGQTPVDNMYINCGWGTGGFKAIPAGGYLLAHSIATGRPHNLAEPFGLDRFRHNRLIDEGAASGIAH